MGSDSAGTWLADVRLVLVCLPLFTPLAWAEGAAPPPCEYLGTAPSQLMAIPKINNAKPLSAAEKPRLDEFRSALREHGFRAEVDQLTRGLDEAHANRLQRAMIKDIGSYPAAGAPDGKRLDRDEARTLLRQAERRSLLEVYSQSIGEDKVRSVTVEPPDRIDTRLLRDDAKAEKLFDDLNVSESELRDLRATLHATNAIVNPNPPATGPVTGPQVTTSRAGVPCTRPTTPDDPKAEVDVSRMRDVALLVADVTDDATRVCSMEMLDSKTGITALHCAGARIGSCDYDTTLPLAKRLKMRALIARAPVPPASRKVPITAGCWGSNRDVSACAFEAIQLEAIDRVVADAGACRGVAPENDIVVVRLKNEPKDSFRPADGFDFASQEDGHFTIAGYGLTDASVITNKMISIHAGVRRTAGLVENAYTVSWLTGAGPGVCAGDSGGPFFRGQRWGAEGEPIRLRGIITAVKVDPSGTPVDGVRDAYDCEKMHSQVLRLEAFKEPLCKALGLASGQRGC